MLPSKPLGAAVCPNNLFQTNAYWVKLDNAQENDIIAIYGSHKELFVYASIILKKSLWKHLIRLCGPKHG